MGLAREGGGAREEGKSTQELTAGAVVASASSGTSSVLRIERRRSPAVAMKMAVMAWLQGTRRRVRRGRASRIQGGARGLTGWAWGCWWLRWCSSAVSGASGDERGRETEEGEGMQRVREKREGTRGVVVARIRTKGGLQREAGGGRGARARATPRLCLLAEEEEDKGGKVGWAALVGELGRLGCTVRPGTSSLFFFISVLFFF